MLLEPLLLESKTSTLMASPYASCWNARGLYDPLRFVLRLRPDIHQLLDGLPAIGESNSSYTFRQVQAFSTYFHETIHWWQHVGSTYGLMSSLLYPAQAHLNHKHLKEILQAVGPKKSIRQLNIARKGSKSLVDESINITINNWHDLEFFRGVSVDPTNMRSYVESPYFQSVGHCYHITASTVLWLLSMTIDPQLEVLPDPRKWDLPFRKLREARVDGFYSRSPVVVPPVGARDLFEGQARFSQLQYLFSASDKKLNWADFERLGMLKGEYRSAFDFFLNKVGIEWPDSPQSPEVAMFLLLCDLAINPGEAFAVDIVHFQSFIYSTDPGLRFHMLCLVLKEKHKDLLKSIVRYSKEEYEEVSNTLSKATVDVGPSQIDRAVRSWTEKLPGCRKLLQEDNSFSFSEVNQPLRVFVARFIKFRLQKSLTPEFFCWPGFWAAGVHERVGEFARVFDEHGALFVDKPDGDVYPRLMPARNEASLQKTFDDFYAWSASYELIRQWTVSDGPFDYGFSWLSSKHSRNEMMSWATRNFEHSIGVHPDRFEIL